MSYIFGIGMVMLLIGLIMLAICLSIRSHYSKYTKNIIEKDMKKCDKNNCDYGEDSCVENIVENTEQKKTKCSKDKDCSGLTGAWSCDVKLGHTGPTGSQGIQGKTGNTGATGNCIKQKNYTCFEKIYDYPKSLEAIRILVIIGVIFIILGGILMAKGA